MSTRHIWIQFCCIKIPRTDRIISIETMKQYYFSSSLYNNFPPNILDLSLLLKKKKKEKSKPLFQNHLINFSIFQPTFIPRRSIVVSTERGGDDDGTTVPRQNWTRFLNGRSAVAENMGPVVCRPSKHAATSRGRNRNCGLDVDERVSAESWTRPRWFDYRAQRHTEIRGEGFGSFEGKFAAERPGPWIRPRSVGLGWAGLWPAAATTKAGQRTPGKT